MKRVHLSGVALVLAVTTSAWAGVEPYPAAVQVEEASTKTRAEVIAELHEAERLGLLTSAESDFPSVKASQESSDTVIVWGDARAMRAKIHAETIEANRLGLIGVGEGNPSVATAEQEELIAAAGRRAVETILGAQSAVQTASK
jgi:hypothetical protein